MDWYVLPPCLFCRFGPLWPENKFKYTELT